MKTLMSLLLFISSLAFAEEVKLKLIKRVEVPGYKLGVGSAITLEFVESGKTVKGVFVGRMKGHPEVGDEVLVLDEGTGKVLMVDTKSVRMSLPKSSMQVLVSTLDQSGETCAAYAIYHFWQQMSSMTDNEFLREAFSTERNRMKVLEDSITRYYMGRSSSLRTVLNKFGDSFGYNCHENTFDGGEDAVNFVYDEALKGNVTLMEFNIGPTMTKTAAVVVDYESGAEMDERLWVPRKKGEKNSSGHAVVAAAAFTLKGKRKLVVLDSNWNEPRVWDADDYIGGKTVTSEMIFHNCY